LLLCHAVLRAEPPDEVDCINADDLTIRKKLGENSQGNSIVRIVKCGDKDQSVGDVEVCIAGRESLVPEDYGSRQRQFNDRELFSLKGTSGLQAFEVLGKRLVVGVRCVRFDRRENRRWPDKACDVVDVPVRVIPGNSPPQPDDLVDAEVFAECAFQLLAVDTGIALLDFAEQAFFRGQ